MIIINSGFTILTYISRYDSIDKYEIFNHDSRLVQSGTTSINAINGKIVHSPLYNFVNNELYTYKSYYQNNLATEQLLKCEDYIDTFKPLIKSKNLFKNTESGSLYNLDLQYYSRYEQIDYYEILDHNSRIIYSGHTTINSVNGKITHTGISLKTNNLYTYKAYYQNNLAIQKQIKNDYDLNIYKTPPTIINSFKGLKDVVTILIIDGGSASYVGVLNFDGGSASFVSSDIINGI